MPDWAQSLNYLWSVQDSFNIEVESQYNSTVSREPPHCSVCSLFEPVRNMTLLSNTIIDQFQMVSQNINFIILVFIF